MGAATLFRLGDPEKPIECTERCLSLKPDDGNAWGILGEALRDSGSCKAATDAYLESIKLEPETLVLHERLILMIPYWPRMASISPARGPFISWNAPRITARARYTHAARRVQQRERVVRSWGQVLRDRKTWPRIAASASLISSVRSLAS